MQIKSNEGRKQQGVHELKQNYHIDAKTKVLGVGAFGRVFQTYNKFNPDHLVAIKVLDKQKLKDNIDCIMEEVAILNQLDHPNIVKYYETYDDQKYIYLVMEYIHGYQLFEMITAQENQTFSEEVAAGYMKSLFQAINHCHAVDVIHRDIKPENIMVTKENSVRLIDFGLSKASKNKNLSTVAGTPYYMAPEVLDGSYGQMADLWSLGVLLYTLVSGYLPFQGTNSHEVFRKIKEADFHFNHEEFKSISAECKDLISKLLVVNQKKRLTGQQALKHAWFTMLGLDKSVVKDKKLQQDPISDEVIERLRQFKGVSTFKKAAMNLLVKTATEDEVSDLRAQFQAIDTDGTGMIKASELTAVMKQKQLKMSDTEIKGLIDEMDYHNNGKINYSEFLSATINIQNFLTDQRLLAIFNQFDTDNSNKITEDNIYFAMQKLGHEIPRSEISKMIKQHDLKNDGVLSFEEFKMIFEEKDVKYKDDPDDVFMQKKTPQIASSMV